MLVRSYSSQDELNRKVKMCHKGYMKPRKRRNFGVFGLARRFSTIIFTVLQRLLERLLFFVLFCFFFLQRHGAITGAK